MVDEAFMLEVDKRHHVTWMIDEAACLDKLIDEMPTQLVCNHGEAGAKWKTQALSERSRSSSKRYRPQCSQEDAVRKSSIASNGNGRCMLGTTIR